MEISETGKNLLIVVDCDYSFSHNWMAFTLWYSLRKNLPDAEMVLNVVRKSSPVELFSWAVKFKVRLSYSKFLLDDITDRQILHLPPHVMAVRDFSGGVPLGPVDIKSDYFSVFVDYKSGCGAFVTAEWINRKDIPLFNATKKFFTKNISVNESKGLKLWERAGKILSTI